MSRPNRIKEIRKARGLTALELATRLQVREQTVFAYESGKTSPSLDVARRLAETLAVTIEELYPEPEEASA